MKIISLTAGAAALVVSATMTLSGPAVASHGSDDGPGDDRGRRHGGHGADDRSDQRRDDRGRDRSRGRRGRGADDRARGGRHRDRDDDRRGRGRGRGGHGHDHDHGEDHHGDDDHGHGGGRGDDQRVEASGACSSGAWWELKAKDEDGGIEWEFEVESHVSGQTWQVVVTQNSDEVYSAPATTAGYSPSFSVEDTVADLEGTDTFVATATYGDQTCTGTVVY